MIDSQMTKVKFEMKKSQELKSVTGTPFVITFHPKLREIAIIMKNIKTISIKMKLLNKFFTPFPMLSYCNARKLSSYLVCAKSTL